MKFSKGQVGIEYMVILSFVTFAVMMVLSFAIIYSNQVQDRIRLNQAENFAVQLVNSAETVFFAGEPSKTTVLLTLPSGVEAISVLPEGLLFEVRVNSGLNKRLFESDVPLSGSISVSEGVKKLTLTAEEDEVLIN